MGKQVIPFTTESAWLDARLHDITSTECAALFNQSPYATPFELYYAKSTGEKDPFTDNDRMRWGRRLQDPIAIGVAEGHGVAVRKMTEYVRDTEQRIGSSFDFEIVEACRAPYQEKLRTLGNGLMEIKCVDLFAFKDNWVIVNGDVVEAPPHIELQVQHQMLVSGAQWALIVALVGGNRVNVIERAYSPQLGNAIMRKAREFWALVDAGTPPLPDYTRDAELIIKMYREATAGKALDASDDSELAGWVEQYQALGEGLRMHHREREAMRARILERIGDAAKVQLANDMRMSAGTVRESVVPQFTRSAYRNIRITHAKGAQP